MYYSILYNFIIFPHPPCFTTSPQLMCFMQSLKEKQALENSISRLTITFITFKNVFIKWKYMLSVLSKGTTRFSLAFYMIMPFNHYFPLLSLASRSKLLQERTCIICTLEVQMRHSGPSALLESYVSPVATLLSPCIHLCVLFFHTHRAAQRQTRE